MANVVDNLKSLLINIFSNKFDMAIVDSDVIIETPKEKSMGDYATNIAMKMAKQLHNSPVNIANIIVEELKKDSSIKNVVVAGPGFINIFMNEDSISSIINTVLNQGKEYGKNESGKHEKILVEYVSANPTGDLHVGHAKGAAWGDAITRLLNFSGYDCTREYYINDAGMQMNNLAKSLIARYYEVNNRPYEFPEDGYHGKDVIELAKQISEEEGPIYLDKKEEDIIPYFRKKGLELELAKIKAILDEYGVSFDVWTSELDIRANNRVEKTVQALTDKGYTYEQDGAVWFKSTEFGDDKDRVLIKSDGQFTYLTPDITYHLNKLERGNTHLVDLLGADHHGYIGRMKAALQAFGYSKDCLEIDILQMVRLIENGEEVKMSKRTGKSVTLRDLIDDIGVDTTRYFFCSRSADTHLDFDLTLAKSQTNDNPVFYAQYAHARMCSILANAPQFKKQDKYVLLTDSKETELLKHIASFTEEVALAAKNRAPNKICNYIQRLASLFHSYYGSCRVVDKENEALTNERLALISATRVVLENALNLIGVSSPEKM